MITLKQLKSRGSLPVTFEEVVPSKAILYSASQLNALSVTQINRELVVVIDNYKWIATFEGKSVSEADLVYSCDGSKIMLWDKRTLQLSELSLIDGMLAVSWTKNLNKKKERGKKFMSKFEDVTMESLDAFAMPNATPDTTATPVGGTIAPKTVANANRDLHTFNRKYGMFHAFITGNEAAIKVSKKKTPMLDASGKKMLNPDATITPEVEAAYKEGKRVSNTYLQMQTDIVFREGKPSPILGGIIAVPKGCADALSVAEKIASGEKVEFDESQKDLVNYVLDKNQLNSALTILFHGTIKENPNIVKEATTISVVNTKVKKKDPNALEEQVSYRTKLVATDRKSLLTDENYIPLKVFEKANQQNPTAEEAAGLNMAIQATIKTADAYNELSNDTKSLISWDASNPEAPVTSEYFKAGAKGQPIKAVRFFDNKIPVDVMNIPIRERALKKDGQPTYKYVTHKLDDPKGPLSVKGFSEILDKIGMSEKDFIQQATALTKKNSSKPKADDISIDQYLEALVNNGSLGNAVFEGAVSPSDLSDILNAVM